MYLSNSYLNPGCHQIIQYQQKLQVYHQLYPHTQRRPRARHGRTLLLGYLNGWFSHHQVGKRRNHLYSQRLRNRCLITLLYPFIFCILLYFINFKSKSKLNHFKLAKIKVKKIIFGIETECI